jgi:hypothetical protein
MSKKFQNIYHIDFELKTFLILTFVLNVNAFWAQQDTIVLHSGETIIGEFKEMKRNIGIVGTDFTENDLEIKWNQFKRLNTQDEYLITLTSGNRFSGRIASADDKAVFFIKDSDTLKKSNIKNIVYIRQIKNDFLDRLDASLSIGYNFTKANNLSQYSVRSNLGYKAEQWLATARYNQIIATQDDIERTQRTDANAVYNRFLKKNWFVLGEVNLLSNTAQNINLRSLGKLGLGKYLIQSNDRYWGLQTGISFNNESFSTETGNTSNNSTEAFLGTEVNFYDVGDFHMLSRIVVYPSLTESGRWRSDFNLDIKYDLPFDFFVNLGFSLNYDNQPVQTGVETDYIFQTTLGWSL